MLDRPGGIPALLAVGALGAAAAVRRELSRQVLSLLLSRRLWSSYPRWSALTRAPPALAVLFARLLLQAAETAASAATAATRRALERWEAQLLESSLRENVLFVSAPPP